MKIRNIVTKINSFLYNAPLYQFFLVVFLLEILIIATTIATLQWASIEFDIEKRRKMFNDIIDPFNMLLVCVLGPFLETLIFQYIPLAIAIKYKKEAWGILFSGILFGLAHDFGMGYILTMMVVGVYYATVFVLAEQKRLWAFWIIFALHAMWNSSLVAIAVLRS